MDDDANPTVSSSTGKNRKPGTFQKGDVRINRKGRPRNFDALKAFTLAVWHEPAYDAENRPIVFDGKQATNIEVVVRSMVRSKDWRQRERALEIAFGKVPDKIEHSGPDGGPVELRIVEQIVASRRSDDEPASGPSQVS
jgi:hypothetical protein